MSDVGSDFSAAEQGLGYIFQPRFALLRILALPEDCVVYIERNDDVEFVKTDGRVSLASLKHKVRGDRLSDLSTDSGSPYESGWLITRPQADQHLMHASYSLLPR
jgi:hypothetical protein